MYIHRAAEPEISNLIKQFPVVAIVGPRQCGKSTLAKHLLSGDTSKSLYIDLELPSDHRKLNDPERFLSLNAGSLVCIDEVQRKPEIFPIIRSLSDRTGRPGQYLILGSASPDLLRQSSESLAGRIAYCYLTPFLLAEVGKENLAEHWLHGGFPGSWLPQDNTKSSRWRSQFVQTYLEKDVGALGFSVNIQVLRRLWTMLAHGSGQLLNKAKLGESLGVSSPTVQAYIDILEKTFMVRVLQPYFQNVKKRLVKSPKVYIRDTGIMHSLLEIDSTNDLLGHPVYGQSWESYAVEQIASRLPQWRTHFYRTSDGTELDLLLTRGMRKIAVECKASLSPTVGVGFYHSIKELDVNNSYIVCPLETDESYPYDRNINVASIESVVKDIKANEENSISE